MVRIRLARPGQGSAVEALVAVALGGDGEVALAGAFAAAIEAGGGRIRLPYGEGLVLVACPADDSGQVLGMLYVCPPIRLIDDCADLGRQVQQRLTEAVAEVELLAVAERARRRGIGGMLLDAARDTLRGRSCKLLYVKVRHDDKPVLGWYRRRGYQLLPQGQPIVIRVAGRPVGFADGTDGYRVLVKPI
ncbi:GNAT family N-acetyltransferase [Nonomuraea jabiensis]|uniref:GNAT family N-acetyltransferase n=1 Tax=Nonomuraea jabiensis TaxID=882448 RepID=UPI003D75DB58